MWAEVQLLMVNSGANPKILEHWTHPAAKWQPGLKKRWKSLLKVVHFCLLSQWITFGPVRLKIWNSLLVGNSVWKSPREFRLMINLLPVAKTSGECRWSEGQSLPFPPVSGAFSLSPALSLGDCFHLPSVLKEKHLLLSTGEQRGCRMEKLSSHYSLCPSGWAADIKSCWNASKTCTAGFGNLLRLMKAGLKKWAEALRMVLISGLKLISAFCSRVIEAFLQKSG